MQRVFKNNGTLIFLILFLGGCSSSSLGGGTRGSIKAYDYSTTKSELSVAVADVIKSNPNIYPDTIRNFMIDETNGKHDTIFNDYYNDGKTYVTMTIKVKDMDYEYTFRYMGDEKTWEAASNSEIFICYIYDKNGLGGSEGDGNFEKIPIETKKQMLDLFETEFIDKVDRKLNLKHI